MFNIYYILLSFTIVNLTYITSKNPNLLKNTIYTYISNSKLLSNDSDESDESDNSNESDNSDESNEPNKYNEINNDNIESIEELTINSNIKSFNKKNIIKIPTYLELINQDEFDYIPENINNEFNINKNNKNNKNNNDKNTKLTQLVIITFLNIKYIFIKLFYYKNKLLINNLHDFIKFYKNIIKNQTEYNDNINICLLFYNNINKQYFYIKNKALIKINNFNEYESIYHKLKNNNIFVIKNNNNKLILSYGEYCNFKLTKYDIPKLFNNNLLNNLEYKKLFEYTNISIIYWISKAI
jgi:hypothetical protein